MAAALLIDNAKWPSERCLTLLRSTELFGKFQYPALRALLTASRLVALKQSRALFTGKDAALSAFVLAEGVLRHNFGADSERPHFLTPPSVIGETALVVGCLRLATVSAETDSVLIEIPRATFLRVIAEFPEGAAQTRRLISGHLRKLVDELDAVRLRLDGTAADDQSVEDAIETLWRPSVVET